MFEYVCVNVRVCVRVYMHAHVCYSRENLFEILGTPVKISLENTGTPVKTC